MKTDLNVLQQDSPINVPENERLSDVLCRSGFFIIKSGGCGKGEYGVYRKDGVFPERTIVCSSGTYTSPFETGVYASNTTQIFGATAGNTEELRDGQIRARNSAIFIKEGVECGVQFAEISMRGMPPAEGKAILKANRVSLI